MAHQMVKTKKKHGGKKHPGRAEEMHVRRITNGFMSQNHMPQGANPGEYQKPAETFHPNTASLKDHMDNVFGEGGQDTNEPTTDADDKPMSA